MPPTCWWPTPKAMSNLRFPLDFCHFSTFKSSPSIPFAVQQLLFMLFLRLPSLLSRCSLPIALFFFSLLFLDYEKCSTRFSLLIYVLARFSYSLELSFLAFRGKAQHPSFNFTCQGCICRFLPFKNCFLANVKLKFNEQFFISFLLGLPICLGFYLRNSGQQLPAECDIWCDQLECVKI